MMRNAPALWGRWLLAANLILLLGAAVFCRAVALDHVPGLNGDEAWQGVQAQRVLRGEVIGWRTPTGNPINPLMFLPMLALHAWLPPSVTLLRLTPLCSGVAALAVNYLLCRRLFGRQLAAISTVILAVLPATVAYSRFAWDASQTVLITLPVVYCALGMIREPSRRQGWLLGIVGAFSLALLVHPTNLFLAPLIATVAAWCWRREAAAWVAAHKRSLVPMGLVGFGVAAIALGMAWHRSDKLAEAAGRVVSLPQAAVFTGRVVDLLSGTTVYRYIPAMQIDGTDPATFAYRLAAWMVLFAGGVGVWRTVQQRRHIAIRILLAGLGASLAAFYLAAGPGAVQPHVERYSMWMIAPLTLLLAMGIQWWMRCAAPTWRLRPATALLLAWALLAGFGWYYLRPLQWGLGEAHLAFRTAATEPKQQALRIMAAERATVPTQIVADGWWLYWPLTYLAGDDSRVSIVPENVPGETPQYFSSDSLHSAWHATLVDNPRSDRSATPLVAKDQQPLPMVLNDAAGRPLLRLARPKRNVSAKRMMP